MKRTFVFPGQGSQYVGMGKPVFDTFLEAKEVFQEVDEVLKQKLSKIIFEGPMEDLTKTINTQPALMATSIAILRVLEKQGGRKISDLASFVAGHSLGEYTALCASGSISLADTARLLHTRGKAMQEAVPQGQGGMAVVMGVDFEVAKKIAEEAASGDVCQAANDNSPGQVVISGSAAAIGRVATVAAAHGAKRTIPLAVSAPFHCALMEPAAKVMQEALSKVEVKAPSVPLIANVVADAVSDPAKIREYLVKQVTGTVRWRESIGFMETKGITQTVEVGAGSVLSGLTKRSSSVITGVSIEQPADIEKFLGSL